MGRGISLKFYEVRELIKEIHKESSLVRIGCLEAEKLDQEWKLFQNVRNKESVANIGKLRGTVSLPFAKLITTGIRVPYWNFW